MFSASVIICTHNPRKLYLRRVLEALREQTLPLEHWELLLIDNASAEILTSTTWDLSWHYHARLIREDELGLAFARLRGMREASADLIVFVDDDNMLEPNYLVEAIRIGHEWPILGVWGAGSIVPEFEIRPPDYLNEFLHLLALREIKTARWSNLIPVGATPWGAGQCVRASVAGAYCRQFESSAIKITDRRGTGLQAGGDEEICYVACNSGFGVGIFPELKLTHLIPRERVQEDYLVRIAEGGWTSDILMLFKWHQIVPKSPFVGLGPLRVVKGVLQKKGIHRRMYLASLRATMRARHILLMNQIDNEGARSNSRFNFLGRRVLTPQAALDPGRCREKT
jgi:glycosyltransferase involved in cell wall biosynthesis